MVNDSYFWFDDDDDKMKYTFLQSSQEKWVSWKHTAHILQKKINERIDLILDTHLTEYTWQVIMYSMFAHMIDCMVAVGKKSSFSLICMKQPTEYDGTTTSDTKPQKKWQQ